jgi:hypothetical protein
VLEAETWSMSSSSFMGSDANHIELEETLTGPKLMSILNVINDPQVHVVYACRVRTTPGSVPNLPSLQPLGTQSRDEIENAACKIELFYRGMFI